MEFTTYVVTGATVWEGYVAAIVFGRYHGSDIVRTRLGGRLQLAEPLTAEFNVRSAHLRQYEDEDWVVGDLKTNYRLSGTMFIRSIVRGMHYSDNAGDTGSEQRLDLDLLYGWEFSPGSMFYAAFTQPFERADGTTGALDPVATVKLSYLMNI